MLSPSRPAPSHVARVPIQSFGFGYSLQTLSLGDTVHLDSTELGVNIGTRALEIRGEQAIDIK